jgi:hypothetical protein
VIDIVYKSNLIRLSIFSNVSVSPRKVDVKTGREENSYDLDADDPIENLAKAFGSFHRHVDTVQASSAPILEEIADYQHDGSRVHGLTQSNWRYVIGLQISWYIFIQYEYEGL